MKELVEIIKVSNADFVILGGDFNCDPVENQDETTLKDITDIMVSSIEEVFPKKEVEISREGVKKKWISPPLVF